VQVAGELAELQTVTAQQAARLAQLTQQLQQGQEELAASRAQQDATQQQLLQREAELAGQVGLQHSGMHGALDCFGLFQCNGKHCLSRITHTYSAVAVAQAAGTPVQQTPGMVTNWRARVCALCCIQVAELEQLAEALSDAQEAGSNMRWELLAKEAALSSMAQQLADAEQTAARAAAAQAVSEL
jgi:hypothetical protein